jgi:hypothetical protein
MALRLILGLACARSGEGVESRRSKVQGQRSEGSQGCDPLVRACSPWRSDLCVSCINCINACGGKWMQVVLAKEVAGEYVSRRIFVWMHEWPVRGDCSPGRAESGDLRSGACAGSETGAQLGVMGPRDKERGALNPLNLEKENVDCGVSGSREAAKSCEEV